jgi:curved DNA-binding protein
MSHRAPNSSDFALLGVAAGADETAVRRAFLQAVKAARPDRGGDPEHYRELIAAYRRLNDPGEEHDLDLHIEIRVTADQARDGGSELVRLPTGKTVRVTLPAGLETGRTLRLRRQGLNAPGRWGDVYLRVEVVQTRRILPLETTSPSRPSASALLRRFSESWAA